VRMPARLEAEAVAVVLDPIRELSRCEQERLCALHRSAGQSRDVHHIRQRLRPHTSWNGQWITLADCGDVKITSVSQPEAYWRTFQDPSKKGGPATFIEWLAHSTYVRAWHVELDAFYTGAWALLFDMHMAKRADILARWEYTGRDWEHFESCHVYGLPCTVNDSVLQLRWHVARFSRDVARHLSGGFARHLVRGHHEATPLALCRRTRCTRGILEHGLLAVFEPAGWGPFSSNSMLDLQYAVNYSAGLVPRERFLLHSFSRENVSSGQQEHACRVRCQTASWGCKRYELSARTCSLFSRTWLSHMWRDPRAVAGHLYHSVKCDADASLGKQAYGWAGVNTSASNASRSPLPSILLGIMSSTDTEGRLQGWLNMLTTPCADASVECLLFWWGDAAGPKALEQHHINSGLVRLVQNLPDRPTGALNAQACCKQMQFFCAPHRQQTFRSQYRFLPALALAKAGLLKQFETGALDWLVLVDDDAAVTLPLLQRALAGFDVASPLYVGDLVVGFPKGYDLPHDQPVPYACGGGGTILSRGALLAVNFESCVQRYHGGCHQSDWIIGRCMADHDIHAVWRRSCGMCMIGCDPQNENKSVDVYGSSEYVGNLLARTVERLTQPGSIPCFGQATLTSCDGRYVRKAWSPLLKEICQLSGETILPIRHVDASARGICRSVADVED